MLGELLLLSFEVLAILLSHALNVERTGDGERERDFAPFRKIKAPLAGFLSRFSDKLLGLSQLSDDLPNREAD